MPVRCYDGNLVLLKGCYLYEVPDLDTDVAISMIKHHTARRLHRSDDWGVAAPIVIKDLLLPPQIRRPKRGRR
jgi:hypothetical protein